VYLLKSKAVSERLLAKLYSEPPPATTTSTTPGKEKELNTTNERHLNDTEIQALARVEQCLSRNNNNHNNRATLRQTQSVSQRLLASLSSDGDGGGAFPLHGGQGMNDDGDLALNAEDASALDCVQDMLRDDRDLVKSMMVSQRLLSIIAEADVAGAGGGAGGGAASDDDDDERGRVLRSVATKSSYSSYSSYNNSSSKQSDQQINPADDGGETTANEEEEEEEDSSRSRVEHMSMARRWLSRITESLVGFGGTDEGAADSAGAAAAVPEAERHCTTAKENRDLECVEALIRNEDNTEKSQAIARVVFCAIQGQSREPPGSDAQLRRASAEAMLTKREIASLGRVLALVQTGLTVSSEAAGGDEELTGGGDQGGCSDNDDDDDDDARLLKAKAASMRLLSAIMAVAQVDAPKHALLAD
jgi:hypothetical protein